MYQLARLLGRSQQIEPHPNSFQYPFMNYLFSDADFVSFLDYPGFLTLCTLGRSCCVWGTPTRKCNLLFFTQIHCKSFGSKHLQDPGSKRIYRQTRHLNPFEQKHIFRHFNFFLFFLPHRGQFLSILSLAQSAQYCGILLT